MNEVNKAYASVQDLSTLSDTPKWMKWTKLMLLSKIYLQLLMTSQQSMRQRPHKIALWHEPISLCKWYARDTIFELFRGDYRSCEMFSWWKKKYIYIPYVPHKNNCKNKIGSHDMKQTDSSILIVRNVCVLTSASMIVYLFFTRSWSTKTCLHEAMIGNHRNKTTES